MAGLADTFPESLPEFQRMFPDDGACAAYLEALRWPEGFVCPRCGGTEFWRMKQARLLCRACRRQCSVTVGTIFQDSRLPLTLWFRAMWHLTSQKNGASALGVQRVLGLGSYQTAWAWLQKLRRAMVRPGRDDLAGAVQVDETYVGGEKSGKSGRGAAGKSLVLIAAQIEKGRIGRIRLQQVANASGAVLLEAVQTMVCPGSTVQTDGWGGYSQFSKHGYVHEVVRESAEMGENLLPACHQTASLLKRWILGTHQGAVSHEHLAYYLDEFTFRFNRRKSHSRGKLFYRLAQQAVLVEPAPYSTLVKRHP